MLIKSRAPLRLGFAGGGTDVSPYCDIYGGYVLNGTIDRYAYAAIKILKGKKIRFLALDLSINETHDCSDLFESDSGLRLHRAVYLFMIKHFNRDKPIALELTTFCDVPAGSGMGSSSAMVVAIIRAFTELLNLPLDNYAIASLAFRIERIECGFEGGRQDQYAAALGGFNFMEFYASDRVIINSMKLNDWILNELESSMILYYTGVSRDSAKIILDQSSGVSLGLETTIDALHGVKQEAVEMRECLTRGDFSGLVKSMLLGWDHKKRSSNSISNALIDEIYESSINSGALAGKISGAGGGGFMLLFVPIKDRINVINNLNKYDGYVSNCHFTFRGSESWRVP